MADIPPGVLGAIRMALEYNPRDYYEKSGQAALGDSDLAVDIARTEAATAPAGRTGCRPGTVAGPGRVPFPGLRTGRP